MSSHRFSTTVIYFSLRVAVLLVILPFFIDLILNTDIDDGFLNGFVKFLFISIYSGVAIFFFIISNSRFDFYGFSILLAASIYKLITSLLEAGISYETTYYIFLIVVSVYFINKNRGKKKYKHTTFV